MRPGGGSGEPVPRSRSWATGCCARLRRGPGARPSAPPGCCRGLPRAWLVFSGSGTNHC